MQIEAATTISVHRLQVVSMYNHVAPVLCFALLFRHKGMARWLAILILFHK